MHLGHIHGPILVIRVVRAVAGFIADESVDCFVPLHELSLEDFVGGFFLLLAVEDEANCFETVLLAAFRFARGEDFLFALLLLPGGGYFWGISTVLSESTEDVGEVAL